MDGAHFGEVTLPGARVGGQISMTNATFGGTLNMNSVQIEGSLYMGDSAQFEEVNLIGARVSGQLVMIDATFLGTLDMGSVQIESSLLMRGANLASGTLDLTDASVVGTLDLRFAQLGGDVRLMLLTLTGELRIAGVTWRPGSTLDLRNARVGSLIARSPGENLERARLEGFQYAQLGGTTGTADLSARAIEGWLSDDREWLRNDESHSPQPHEQLARLLREAGRPDQARQTLYEGKNHELAQALGSGRLLDAAWLVVTLGVHRLRASRVLRTWLDQRACRRGVVARPQIGDQDRGRTARLLV